VIGIDFTSAPRRRKPITGLTCEFDGQVLRAISLEEWPNFSGFEEFLRRQGPWIAGIDFPFGQARRFVETIGWPASWHGYVLHAHSLGRKGFRDALDTYRANRHPGDKEHRRRTDVAAGSISPQKLFGVPVGLMFFEGAHRLIEAEVTIPGLQEGDPNRVVVEAYPGVLARRLIGRQSYKNDTKKKQTQDQLSARHNTLERLRGNACRDQFGFDIEVSDDLCDDPTGDQLDALLCAIQAAWSWKHRDARYGAPSNVDTLEGWIADPAVS